MAGYSGTPLIKKLGIKDGMRVHFINAPTHLPKLLGPLPTCVTEASKSNIDFTHAFFYERDVFASTIHTMINAMARDGMVWISWPKKASKVPTTMTEGVIREIALPLGLVDVKVCAVDDVWSGLKLMIRKGLR
ncbi:DUF3052 domain-containing protein [Kordiimonas aquimaris]|uniref:DUF3052 domain-containing protein n=1 Tax=Kordiimonas aquimaris TaxID=707591 RepID=UPI0021CFB4FA|nr:DUF3052 domain-containing protein [Kordiimonas aquimaris]